MLNNGTIEQPQSCAVPEVPAVPTQRRHQRRHTLKGLEMDKHEIVDYIVLSMLIVTVTLTILGVM